MVGTPYPRAVRELMVLDSARWKQLDNAETSLYQYLWTAGQQICFWFLELCWAVNKILLYVFSVTCILFLFDFIMVDSFLFLVNCHIMGGNLHLSC